MAKTLSAPDRAEEICPECRVNQVEAPFDYCSLCEMLSSYYRDRLANPATLADEQRFTDALHAWRNGLTWAEVQNLRDTYWTPARRAKARSRR